MKTLTRKLSADYYVYADSPAWAHAWTVITVVLLGLGGAFLAVAVITLALQWPDYLGFVSAAGVGVFFGLVAALTGALRFHAIDGPPGRSS